MQLVTTATWTLKEGDVGVDVVAEAGDVGVVVAVMEAEMEVEMTVMLLLGMTRLLKEEDLEVLAAAMLKILLSLWTMMRNFLA